jgi:hypothetical protein
MWPYHDRKNAIGNICVLIVSYFYDLYLVVRIIQCLSCSTLADFTCHFRDLNFLLLWRLKNWGSHSDEGEGRSLVGCCIMQFVRYWHASEQFTACVLRRWSHWWWREWSSWNVCQRLPDYTIQFSRSRPSSCLSLWDTEISPVWTYVVFLYCNSWLVQSQAWLYVVGWIDRRPMLSIMHVLIF